MIHYSADEVRGTCGEGDRLVGVATATRAVPRGLGGTGRGCRLGSLALGAVLAVYRFLFSGGRCGGGLAVVCSLVVQSEGRGGELVATVSVVRSGYGLGTAGRRCE